MRMENESHIEKRQRDNHQHSQVLLTASAKHICTYSCALDYWTFLTVMWGMYLRLLHCPVPGSGFDIIAHMNGVP